MQDHSARARTMVELLMFIMNIVIATIVAGLGWHKFGWVGLILGFVCGFAILPAVFYLTIFFLHKDQGKGKQK